MSIRETWEAIRLEELVQPEVDQIVKNYNLSTPQGINAALRQAVWIGMCHGKGWIENE